MLPTADATKSRRNKRKLGLAPETSQQDEADAQDTTHLNAEEANAQETIQPSSGATETQEEIPKAKKTRGPTKMRGVAKHHADKVDVEYTLLGEPVGKGYVTLSSFLGPLVREHVHVLLDDWRHLDDQTKDRLWEEIQVFSIFYITSHKVYIWRHINVYIWIIL